MFVASNDLLYGEEGRREALTHYMNVVVPVPPDDMYNFSIVETAEEELQFEVDFADIVEEKGGADPLNEMNASTKFTFDRNAAHSAKEPSVLDPRNSTLMPSSTETPNPMTKRLRQLQNFFGRKPVRKHSAAADV